MSTIKDRAGNIQYYIGIFDDITDKKIASDKIQHAADFDSLTNLPNRRFFVQYLQESLQLAKQNQEKRLLLYFDIDSFKAVNDQYGHTVGDQYLKQASTRLKQAIRQSDCLARLGGDEFVVLQKNITSSEACQARVDLILSRINQAPITIAHHQIPLKFSVGSALYPDDAKDAQALIKYADEAMYVEKQSRHLR